MLIVQISYKEGLALKTVPNEYIWNIINNCDRLINKNPSELKDYQEELRINDMFYRR